MNGSISCGECASGKVSSLERDSCVSCPRGFYEIDKLKCEKCPQGDTIITKDQKIV